MRYELNRAITSCRRKNDGQIGARAEAVGFDAPRSISLMRRFCVELHNAMELVKLEAC